MTANKSSKEEKAENILSKNIEVERKNNSAEIVEDWISGIDINNYIYSAYIRAKK